MGYTHYCTIKRPLGKAKFAKWSKDCKSLCDASSVDIVGGYGDKGSKPIFSDDTVWFNGSMDDGHETFCMTPFLKGENYCKTGGMFVRIKPYDELVVACLARLLHYWPKLKIESDADVLEDIEPGLNLYQSVFGQAPTLFGIKYWYLNGELHRENGPAIEYPNGSKEWFLNGMELTEEEFLQQTKPVKELTIGEVEKLLGYKVKIVKE